MSVDDRVQITDRPLAFPGSCNICGYSGGANSNGRKFIDWGLSVDFIGAVIFCSDCVETIALALGYSKPGAIDELSEKNKELESVIAGLRAENDQLRRAIDSLRLVPTFGGTSDVGDSKEGSDAPGEGSDGTEPSQSDSGRKSPKLSRTGSTPESDRGEPEISLINFE